MLKWILLGIVAIVIAFIGYRLYTSGDVNAQVAAEIRADPTGARAQRTMLITLADGRMYPVNFLREDNFVYMGIDGRWWRDFVGAGQPVELFVQGEVLSGHATTVLDDPELVEDIFSRLRPTVPEWLPDWLNGKLVVIALH